MSEALWLALAVGVTGIALVAYIRTRSTGMGPRRQAGVAWAFASLGWLTYPASSGKLGPAEILLTVCGLLILGLAAYLFHQGAQA